MECENIFALRNYTQIYNGYCHINYFILSYLVHVKSRLACSGVQRRAANIESSEVCGINCILLRLKYLGRSQEVSPNF